MSDSLSNLFSHIQNSQKNRTLTIFCNFTKLFVSILETLQENGYIRGYRIIQNNKPHTNNKPMLAILLKYKNQKPAIKKFIRISKPSKRVYICSQKHLSTPAPVSLMQGLFILSTSHGILSNIEASKLNIGGEILGQV